MPRAALVSFLTLILLVSCNKSSGGGQHATVLLRDGTSVSGTVLSSSASELQIAGDDKLTRTIAMTQVRSVQYDDTSATTTGAAPPPGSPAEPVAPERSHADHYHPRESAVTTRRYQLPAGTQVSVRTEETIDSGKAVEGQTFAGEATNDVRDEAGDVVIPRGSNAQIVIVSASKGGRFHGASDLVLDLASISVDGRLYQVHTAPLEERGKSGVGLNKRTAEYSGGAAAFGAIVGAIAGGGKGAVIGAGSGAGAGALAEILTKGSIKVPVESVLTFRLDQPLRVTAAH
jgi:hypothetical protein